MVRLGQLGGLSTQENIREIKSNLKKAKKRTKGQKESLTALRRENRKLKTVLSTVGKLVTATAE